MGWPKFYSMLHQYLQEQKEKLIRSGISVNEVNLVGHAFGAVHAHALDWLYEGHYTRIAVFDVGPCLAASGRNWSNIIISCYQTQFSRYHMGGPCARCNGCPCY